MERCVECLQYLNLNYIGMKCNNENVNGKNVVAINFNLLLFLFFKIIKIDLKIKLQNPNLLQIPPMPAKFVILHIRLQFSPKRFYEKYGNFLRQFCH